MLISNRITGSAARILAILVCMYFAGCAELSTKPPLTYNPTLHYLEQVIDSEQVNDPQVIFLLMQQYINSNQFKTGIDYFDSVLTKHQSELTSSGRAITMASLAILRASYAGYVPLLKRIQWVNSTIELLESAKRISANSLFPVRWSAGIVYAQLPDGFNKQEAAMVDLQWCEHNIDQAPHQGWLREVYYHQALLHHRLENPQQSRKYLELSGYANFDKKIILTTPYSVNGQKGLSFHPKRLKEIIPGKVFALSGFEFTEYYFVVTADGKQLISIDAGTRPDSAQAAYRFLKSRRPKLPKLTTVLVTHSHWDHIGGHKFFRKLNPNIRFYAQKNYAQELSLVKQTPMGWNYFFGSDFKMHFVADFKPDITVEEPTEIKLGGTRFNLIPITGGETVDGMFIHIPEHRVLFVGDFIMPYLGAPIVEEGNITGLLDTMDIAIKLNPAHLLHGHEPLTRIWNSPQMLAELKPALAWLNQETLNSIRRGAPRAQIHRQNLTPAFGSKDPSLLISYLVMRENMINRIYDRNVGYWESDLAGMDHLSRTELGFLLTEYLNLSESELSHAIQDMINAGDHELAARVIGWALTQYPSSDALLEMQELTFLKLIEKYQEFNPFKFIIYSQVIKKATSQLQSVKP